MGGLSEADSDMSDGELDRLLRSPSPVAEDGLGEHLVIEDSPSPHEAARGSRSPEALESGTGSKAIEEAVMESSQASEALEETIVESSQASEAFQAASVESSQASEAMDKDAAMLVEDSPLKTPVRCLGPDLQDVETPPPTQRSLSTTSLDPAEDSQAARPRRSPPSIIKEPVFIECTCKKPDGKCVCTDSRFLKKKIAALKMQMAARSHAPSKIMRAHDLLPVDSYTTAYP